MNQKYVKMTNLVNLFIRSVITKVTKVTYDTKCNISVVFN